MTHELQSKATENLRDLIIWRSALRTATTSLTDFLEENKEYLQDDHFASHAKNLLRGAASVVGNTESSLIVLQEYTLGLQSMHRKIKYRVERRKKGIDPDKNMLTTLVEVVQKQITNSVTAHALFDRFQHMHNSETRQ